MEQLIPENKVWGVEWLLHLLSENQIRIHEAQDSAWQKEKIPILTEEDLRTERQKLLLELKHLFASF